MILKNISYTFFAISFLCACSNVNNYDVPKDAAGRPTVASIVERIQCEIVNIVRDDRPDDPISAFGKFLRQDNFDIEASLSVEVTDGGGLSPTLAYVLPYSAAAGVAWGAGFTLSESRDQKFTENLSLNVVTIYERWRRLHAAHPEYFQCPGEVTNLAGDLGISEMVAMAFSSTYALDQKNAKSAFGGEIHFIVTKSINAAGPTWTLTHFKGPGGLAGLSEANTDDLTIGFAKHADAGGGTGASQRNQTAYQLVLQIQANSANALYLQLLVPR